jgi:hypothetical protein
VTKLLPPALAFALALPACNTGFEPQYRVTDLRILAVRSQVVSSIGCTTSTPPSAAPCADATPDDTLALEALVANPRGRTDLLVRWYACAPSATDAPPPCIDDAVLSDPEVLATMPGVIALPTSGTGERVTIPLSAIPQAALQAGLDFVVSRATSEPTFQCRAFAEVPVVLIATAGGVRDVALKRVRLVPRDTTFAYRTNANPRIFGLFHGANADLCSGDGATSLSAGPVPAGRIAVCGAHDNEGGYAVCDAAGNASPTVETYGWQWYVTAGEFPDSGGVGNETDDAPDFERPPGPFTLWAILRDGRGGVDWARVDVP